MAICRWIGYPDLFLTFTCNPKWPEIARFVEHRCLKADDRPDIISRIFKIKLDNLIKDLRQNKVFGTVRAVMYTVEFQKRGLPHAHILLFLSKEDKYPTAYDIDCIISAEIPDKDSDPEYYAAVRDYMMHGPCGNSRRNSHCMSNGRCTKHFPKKFVESTNIDDDGYPIYRRRDDGRTVVKNGVHLDNQYVVPHNRYLLMKYDAHLNVEWCNQSRSIKYLFNYVNKGHDRVTVNFCQSNGDDEAVKNIDEINMHYDCRYISPCEVAWRIFGFEIQYKDPPVERLSFHLENQQNVVFSDSDTIDDVMNRPSIKQSMFLAWMDANKKYPKAKELTYAQFPNAFVWYKKAREWRPRKRGFSIGRIFSVPPGCGEMYYLRCLLNIIPGPTCFDDLMCVDGVQYNCYKDACYALGLVEDYKEYIDGITEASHWSSANSLRRLFATLLVSESLSRPDNVWEKCWQYLSDDILYNRRNLLQHEDLVLSDEEIKSYTLVELEKLLRSSGKSLRDINSMPYPDENYFSRYENRLIQDELRYDKKALSEEHINLLSNLNNEQRYVYDTVMDAVNNNKGGLFFVYGYGGTVKTFVWKTLSTSLRSKGDIVLNVASSGIASLLLPSGRTAHSRFAIPLTPNEDSTCNIKQGSPMAELLIKSKLIIWDEAPMMNIYCFEALDKTMRDILRFSNPRSFDFRQILPVIPKGTRQDIVLASINSSYLWRDCTVLRLTRNMRLQHVESDDDWIDLKCFSEWIACIGDGTIGDSMDGHAIIDIPDDMLLDASDDPVACIVKNTYPDYTSDVNETGYLQGRAILAPTLDVVETVNDYMISLNTVEAKTYLSSDTTCKSDHTLDILQDIHTPEFLNAIRCSGVPNHELKLKVGTPVMLMRNIDHSMGLCNGTKLVITRCGSKSCSRGKNFGRKQCRA